MKKIGKVQLAEAVKKSIIENGGGEERANLISETLIRRLDEMGPKTTALAQGAGFNADNQFNNNDKYTEKNYNKMDRAREKTLSSMNHAINTNFPNLTLYFRWYNSGRNAIVSRFEFNKVINIDGDRMVMSGIFHQKTEPQQEKGSIEYNFSSQHFYKVNNRGKSRTTPKIEVLVYPPADVTIVKRFVDYMTKYYNAVERYRNDVYNTNNT